MEHTEGQERAALLEQRRRERYLLSDRRRSDVTSEQAEQHRRAFTRTIPQSERADAQAWLDAHRDLLHSEPLEHALERALEPLCNEQRGSAWQAPVALVTLDGEPIDLVGIWGTVVADLMDEPVRDLSEHGRQAQRALERKRLAAADRNVPLPTGQGWQSSADLSVSYADGTGSTFVHFLAAQVEDDARREHRKRRTTDRKRAERDRKRAALAAARAEQEAKRAAQREAMRKRQAERSERDRTNAWQ